jgi:hypothetical protein
VFAIEEQGTIYQYHIIPFANVLNHICGNCPKLTTEVDLRVQFLGYEQDGGNMAQPRTNLSM